jgi:hypothetical protein
MHDLANVHSSGSRPYGEQQTVLLDIVKSIKSPEEISPTSVWFDEVNRVEYVLPGALYFSSLFGFVFRGIVGDWEINPVGLRRAVVGASAYQLEGQVIEGAHQILDRIPGDERNGTGSWFDAADIIDGLSRLRIALDTDFIWVGIEESPDLALKITDVQFGPFNFRPDLREPLVNRHETGPLHALMNSTPKTVRSTFSSSPLSFQKLPMSPRACSTRRCRIAVYKAISKASDGIASAAFKALMA